MKKILLLLNLIISFTILRAQLWQMDPAFTFTQSGVTRILCSVTQTNGKAVILGQFVFTSMGKTYTNIARLNSDGTIDTTFQGISADGGGYPACAAIQPDGKILLGGGFTKYNGITKYQILRINSDGTIDPSFNTGLTNIGGIYAIAIQTDNKIFIGGGITNNIVRLNPDGSNDPSFSVGSGFSNTSSNSLYIFGLKLQPDGKLLACGNFNSYNGATQNGIIRLNSDGSLDNSFISGSGTSTNSGLHPNDINLLSTGQILITGDFYDYNGYTLRWRGVACLNSNGIIDTAFNNNLPFVQTFDAITCARVLPNYKIILAYGSVSSKIYMLNIEGTVNSTFNLDPNNINNRIENFDIQPDSSILVTGYFTQFAGSSVSKAARIKNCQYPPYCGGIIQVEADSSVNYFGDTINVSVNIFGGNNLFSVFGKMSFNSTYLKLFDSQAGNYLGNNIINTPPVVTAGSIDFGITKTSGQPGSNGNGLFYSFRFLVKQLPDTVNVPFNASIPRYLSVMFGLNNLTIYDALGASKNMLTNTGSTNLRYYIPVWPGDLNHDKRVNVADILPIGYFYGRIGPARPKTSLQWIAQPSKLWGYSKTSLNSDAYCTFVDGTGNGIIDLADQSAIGFNLNKFHSKKEDDYNNPNRGFDRAGAVPLVVDIVPTQLDSSQLPTTLNVAVNIGSTSNPVDSLYGLAFDLLFDPNVVDIANIQTDYSNTFFGTLNTDYIKIEDKQAGQGRISIGLTRYNTTTLNTNGKVLTLNLPIKKNAPSGWFKVEAVPLAANDKLGNDKPINYGVDSVLLITNYTPNGIFTVSENEKMYLYPNPNSGLFTVEFSDAQEHSIKITDVLGRVILDKLLVDKQRQIDLKELSNGTYFLNVTKGSVQKQIRFQIIN